jgi:ATP phosphoribosyltransferase regulatory subunit HisZ
MSDTPRTDARFDEIERDFRSPLDCADMAAARLFASQLERELDDSNRLAANQTVKCCKYAERIEDLERELAALLIEKKEVERQREVVAREWGVTLDSIKDALAPSPCSTEIDALEAQVYVLEMGLREVDPNHILLAKSGHRKP